MTRISKSTIRRLEKVRKLQHQVKYELYQIMKDLEITDKDDPVNGWTFDMWIDGNGAVMSLEAMTKMLEKYI